MSAREKVRWSRGARVILSMAFRAAPARAITVVVLATISAASDTVFPLWLKLLVDGIARGDLHRVWFVAGGIAVTLGLSALAGVTGFLMRIGLEERTSYRIDRRTIDLTAGIPGIEHFERPEYLDKLDLLREHRADLSMALGATVENIAMVVRVGGTILLLARLDPLLLFLVLFALPSLFTGSRAQRIVLRADEAVAERRRSAKHLFDLATTPSAGKELRIFGTGPELLAREHALLEEIDIIATRARIRSALLTSAGWIIFAIGYIGAMALIVSRAVHHDATPGDVLLALQLGAQINGQVTGVVMLVGWFMRTMRSVSRFLWLIDHARAATPAPTGLVPLPERIAAGIRLRDVAFHYPGTDTPVLEGVNLDIPAGATVAVVGDNGAGKSTLVKLLCRFYQPTSGSIELDGIDIERFDIEQWRERISAGFQDFTKFELRAQDVVGVGELARIDDRTAVGAALTRASADGVIEQLPTGFDTQLGKSFDDGIELSGGQWQKLALGRAMMRTQPLLLALDEPTAALDAQTEHALFERYAGAAERVARGTGAITLFVSHRFSTVRMADLIVVISGGRVAEAGSHEELLVRRGLYAELYELQARAYR